MLHRTIEALLGQSPDKARVWMLERLDDGRRVVSHGLHDGQKLLHERWEDGLKLFDRSADEGRKALDHGVRDGRKMLDHQLRDGRKVVEAGYRDGRKRFDKGVDEGRRYLDARLSDTRQVATRSTSGPSVLVPALLAVAGAGAAIWWWTQSARKADAAASGKLDAREGGGEAPIDHPELVMAHHVPPPGGPVDAQDKADEKLVEPAEDLMLHAPVDDSASAPLAKSPPSGGEATTPKAGKRSSVGKTAAAALASSAMPTEALDASLGVQGAASAPKGTRDATATGGAAAAPKRRSKGPTIM